MNRTTQQCLKPMFHRLGVAAFVLFLPILVQAQTSHFLFDDNGNLTVQSSASLVPPQITSQPRNVLVATSNSMHFSVVAADPRSLTYQWRFNGSDLGGATGDVLILQNVTTNNEGFYQVVLTNPSGSITSAPAFLWIDDDGDGMADSWELAHFGNLNQAGIEDPDFDKVSNLQEFLDGTDPNDASSGFFHLTIVQDGGLVTRSPDLPGYTNGQSVTLTAIASSNESFHAWFGSILTHSNPVTVVMTSDKTVRARFTPIGFVWTNVAGGDWNVAANWTPNLVPGSNDSVYIADAGAVTLNTSADCADFTLGDATFGGTLTGSGTLTIRGNFLWTQGTMTGNGRTVLETGAVMDVAGGVSLATRTLENGGTVFWTGSRDISLSSGAVITNRAGALFHAQNSASLAGFASAARFDNAGTFRKSVNSGTTTISSGMSFNNSGTVEVQTGTLLCNGAFTNSGAVNLSGSATNRLAGGGAFNAGAQLNGAGLYEFNAGTFNANADLTIQNLDFINATLSGPANVTIANVMNWSGGTMSGTGRTIIQPAATLNATNPSTTVLSGRTLENGGTVLFGGAGTFGVASSGVITNRPGALFRIEGESSSGLGGGGASGRFDNAGTFRKSAGTGTSVVASGLAFNNSGGVEIQTGTLSFAGGGSATGTFDAPAATSVVWSGGTFTLNPGAQLNGSGLFRLNGGNVTANLDLAVENLDLVSAFSTLSGTSMVSVATLMNWTAGTMSGGGRTIIGPGAVMNLGSSSTPSLSSRALENAGTVLWTGSGGITLSSGVITNRPGALFQAQSAAPIFFGSGANRFDNAGTFRKSISSGTTTVQSGIGFNDSGAVEIQTGTLHFNGGITNQGTVTLSAGATNRLAGGGSASGTFTAPATALVEWTSGTFTLNPGAQLNGSGLYRLNGGNVTANLDLAVENLDLVSAFSTLSGTSMVSVATLMNWTAGTMSGGGRTIIGPGAVMNLGSSSSPGLSSRTLENAGTVLWTGSGGIVLAPGVITNRPGALFHVQNAAQISLGFSSGRFDNAGTFRKSVSSGTTTVQSGISFNNSGTVDLRSGILSMQGGYVSSSNALLNSALGGTTAGTNYGQLQVSGTVNLNSGLSVDLLPGFSPATNDTFTVLSAGTRNGTFANFSYPSNRVTMLMSNSPSSVILQVTDVLPIPQPVLLTPQLVGSNALLTWTATSNVIYRLEFNPDIGPTNWGAVPGDVTTSSNTATKLDSLTPSKRFYRVRVLP